MMIRPSLAFGVNVANSIEAMPLTIHPLPFGLRDLKVAPMTSEGVYGAYVDLPASRTLSFQESEDFEELRGDDIVQASHGNGPVVVWTIEGGGLPITALQVMIGGTITETGVTPNQVKTLNKKIRDFGLNRPA